MPCFLTIIIPTYNRRDLVGDTIDSALAFSTNFFAETEILVVDDASTDDTCEHIKKKYPGDIREKRVKLIQNRTNLGVTGALNAGIAEATGKWVLGMGSDDLFVPENSGKVHDILAGDEASPIIFFRCEDLDSGELIGPYQADAYRLTLGDFLNSGTPGECLSVVRAYCFTKFLYDPELRGGEGLTLAQIIQEFGSVRVEKLIARKYRTGGSDQLSFGSGVLHRACQIGKYHRLMISQFYRHLNGSTLCRTMIKIIYYWFACFFIRFRKLVMAKTT